MIEYIKEEKSLNRISRELKLNKSTIYYHYKKIRGKKTIKPSFIIKESEIEGEIVGLFAADGGACPQSQYQVSYYLGYDEEEYAKKFSEKLEEFFNKKVYFYKSKKRSEIILRYSSKDIYYFIKYYLEWKNPKTYSIRLKTINHNINFLRGFLRGYLDGDGYTGRNGRLVYYAGVSKRMLKQMSTILTTLGYSPRLTVYKNKNKKRRDLYFLRLKPDEAISFLKFIDPRNPKRRMGLLGFEPKLRAIRRKRKAFSSPRAPVIARLDYSP